MNNNTEILSQEEFNDVFNGLGYERLGIGEMRLKASHAALLAERDRGGWIPTVDEIVLLADEISNADCNWTASHNICERPFKECSRCWWIRHLEAKIPAP